MSLLLSTMVTKAGIPESAFIIIDEHAHSVQKVAPSAAPGVLLTAGAIWTLGVFSADIIAADAEDEPFDLHWADIEDPDANASYEIVFYYGPADIEVGRCKFTRLAVLFRSFQQHLQTPILPAGSRIRAKVMSSIADSTVRVSILYHSYR